MLQKLWDARLRQIDWCPHSSCAATSRTIRRVHVVIVACTSRRCHCSDCAIWVMCITVVGTRVVFSMPISLRANWIFRVTQVSRAWEYMAAIRRPLFALGVAPVWILSAGILFSLWPWQLVVDHLVVLGLLGTNVEYLCLASFRKIPFTCSYLPGKSYLHVAFLTATGLLPFIIRGVVFESEALRNRTIYLWSELSPADRDRLRPEGLQ